MKAAIVLFAPILAFLPFSTSNLVGALKFSTWGTPVNLGAIVNSSSLEGGPAISKKGLSLYFHSDRSGGFGGTDIWVSQRPSTDSAWEMPQNLGPAINTGFAETVPTFSRDGHLMFFARTRPEGDTDIWASWRPHTDDDFGWQTPVNLGPDINTVVRDEGPAYFAGEDTSPPTLFFVSNRPGGLGLLDVYASERQPEGSFGTPTHVSELSSPSSDARPTIRYDGLEVILFSNRPDESGNFDFDLWGSTRTSLGSTWATPENLGMTVNSGASDIQPQLSSDGEMLQFASDRDGGYGNLDLYVTVRSKGGQ